MVIVCLFFMFRNRKLAIFLLCVIPFGYKNISTTFALHPFSLWSDKKPAKSLRILTWNVQGFANLNGRKSEAEPGWSLVLQNIKDWQPDVACLQEYRSVFGHKKLVDMKDRMDSAGYKYFYCPPDFMFDTYSGVHIMQGVAIFSKYPLVETGSVKILDEGGYVEKMAFADLEFENRKMRIFSAHLASYQLYSQEIYEDHKTYQATMENKRSIMSKIQQREILHEQQVKIIRNHLTQSPYPVIYCGDLNNTPASHTYHYLRGNLQDAWLKEGIGLGKTFYNLAPSLRIDVCLTDTAFRIEQSTVKRVYASDHFPILSDVSWK
jgi:endonuclease/exonuclease/phosphatase family metal-dependent hydrolase